MILDEKGAVMAENWQEPIGHVLRASTAGFSAGARVNQLDGPQFGMVVRAQPRLNSREAVYGLLYDVHIDDDPLVRQLFPAVAKSRDGTAVHRLDVGPPASRWEQLLS